MTRWMLFLPFMVFGVAHAEIQKCEDEAGNWHYGDFAIDACNASKVTTMDQRGVVTDERPAPKLTPNWPLRLMRCAYKKPKQRKRKQSVRSGRAF